MANSTVSSLPGTILPEKVIKDMLAMNPIGVAMVCLIDHGQIAINWSTMHYSDLCYLKEMLDISIKDAMRRSIVKGKT